MSTHGDTGTKRVTAWTSPPTTYALILAGPPVAGPADLSVHSTLPPSLARVAENAGDRYAVARTALSRIPRGGAIIGAADGAERSCATGTAMYVSFVPPMVVIAEHPGSRTCKLIQRSGGGGGGVPPAPPQRGRPPAGANAAGGAPRRAARPQTPR